MKCFMPFDFGSRTLKPADCLPGWLDNSVLLLPLSSENSIFSSAGVLVY